MKSYYLTGSPILLYHSHVRYSIALDLPLRLGQQKANAKGKYIKQTALPLGNRYG